MRCPRRLVANAAREGGDVQAGLIGSEHLSLPVAQTCLLTEIGRARTRELVQTPRPSSR